MAHIPSLSTEVSTFFERLPTNGHICTYIWLGNCTTDVNLRSKARTLTTRPTCLEDFPVWNYDGSSTDQAPCESSEVWIKPVAYFPDPFHPYGENYLVLCENVEPDDNFTPTHDNARRECMRIMDEAKDHEPWFGLEQEYILMNKDGKTPLGWSDATGANMPKQGQYYCSAGAQNAFGRQVSDAHYFACLFAGIKIAGTNLEVFPGQLEYQIGPCTGIEAGDHLVVSRYILLRVAEMFGVVVTFDPKPFKDWSGSGCHTNYSTKTMREENGYDAILEMMPKLEKKSALHLSVYGYGNERRLTGQCETQALDRFSYGIGDRTSSIRIPRTTFRDKKGYIEDRRPASNCCPYKVTGIIVQTTILDK